MQPNASLSPLRIACLVAITLWGASIAAMFRTSVWGYHDPVNQLLGSFGAFCVWALPLLVMALVGVHWRRALKIGVGVIALSVLAVEVFARAQEHLVVQKVETLGGQNYTECRWWPFRHHSLGRLNGEWWGCD